MHNTIKVDDYDVIDHHHLAITYYVEGVPGAKVETVEVVEFVEFARANYSGTSSYDEFEWDEDDNEVISFNLSSFFDDHPEAVDRFMKTRELQA